jgi:hypothetical protein
LARPPTVNFPQAIITLFVQVLDIEDGKIINPHILRRWHVYCTGESQSDPVEFIDQYVVERQGVYTPPDWH